MDGMHDTIEMLAKEAKSPGWLWRIIGLFFLSNLIVNVAKQIVATTHTLNEEQRRDGYQDRKNRQILWLMILLHLWIPYGMGGELTWNIFWVGFWYSNLV